MRGLIAASAWVCAAACSNPSADPRYFGSTQPPAGQVLRYITGPEPESLDPQIGSGQPEARIYIALFDGLTEYDPKTGEAVPSLAERWDIGPGNTEFTFHLRPARWSDGTAITAGDVVYSIQRGLSPASAARTAYMAYDIAYAEAFNSGSAFVREAGTGAFLPDPDNPEWRLVVPGDAGDREKLPKDVKARIDGKELVRVRGTDLGVEAIDDRTVRFRLQRPVPFFPKLVAHQFFRPVPRAAIERYGDSWTRPGHLTASGAFTLEAWKPYDRLTLVRNKTYWDAAAVKLDRITFYPIEDITTMMNLYKAGEVDATFNHTVPASWNDRIRGLKDYMNEAENATEFYYFNTLLKPVSDVRVRKALNMAIDKVALAEFRRTATPLTGFIPHGIFPGYTEAQGDPFNPAQAKQLLVQAGFRNAAGEYDPSTFPAREVDINYNTNDSNRQVAEFVQAQWKQHLGITVALKNSEFRTFLVTRARKDYKGLARAGWIGDYIDPYTFLDLLSTNGGENGTGWTDPRYLDLLRQANRELDPQKRYQILGRAEALLLEAQPVLPLYTPATNWLKKPYVKGMYANPLTLHPWKFVYIEHDSSKWD
ncbi:MAG: peptide ABC transporter substrate-binding protein [Acidobacteriota bacterium]